MERPSKLTFANGLSALTIQVQSETELPSALTQLGIRYPRPTLAVVGGASKMTDADLSQLYPLFTEALAPLAERLGLIVVDGGSDAGVIGMMGQARAATGGTFPLIGVAPVGRITLPEAVDPLLGSVLLEPHHTHFILVPGATWGDDSPWLVKVASVLSQAQPSVTILVNGGDVALKDVSENVKVGRPVITVAGSGRMADTLFAALQGEGTSQLVLSLAASGLVSSINLRDNLETLALDQLLSSK